MFIGVQQFGRTDYTHHLMNQAKQHQGQRDVEGRPHPPLQKLRNESERGRNGHRQVQLPHR